MRIYRPGLRFAERLCSAAASPDPVPGGSPGASGAAAGNAAAAASGVAATGGGADSDWRGGIPETIRNDPVFFDLKGWGDVATKLHGTQKLLGDRANLVALPSGPDDSEAYNKLFAALGRPESADKYAFEAPKDLPKGLSLDADLDGAFRKFAHEAGLSQRQAQGAYAMWNGYRAAQFGRESEAIQERLQAFTEGLKSDREFGGQAYEQNAMLAKMAMTNLGLPDTLAMQLIAVGIDPAPTIKALAKVGRTFKEDPLLGGGSGAGAGDGAMSPAQAESEIAKKMADPAFSVPYMNKAHPGHADAMAQMGRLQQFRATRAVA
jgi:hypothetical protein